MRIHAEWARSFLAQHTVDDMRRDDMLQAAVARCVEVVGEAARLVSEQTRAQAPGIPWTLVVGMRNTLAHDYGAVDLDKVHEVVVVHLPALPAGLQVLIRQLEQEVGWADEES